MRQLITYSDDTAALLDEVLAVAPELHHVDEAGRRFIGPLVKTPSVKAGNETLAVLREVPEALQHLQHLRVIGYVDEPQPGEFVPVFTAPDGQIIYDRLYPRLPVVWTDPDGVAHTYTPPLLFGVLA